MQTFVASAQKFGQLQRGKWLASYIQGNIQITIPKALTNAFAFLTAFCLRTALSRTITQLSDFHLAHILQQCQIMVAAPLAPGRF